LIVVDASVILEVVLNTPAAPRLMQRLIAPGETLHAPHLLDLEVTQVLRRYCVSGASPWNAAFTRSRIWRTFH
jgi:predicted nucleic acid-binding protein